MTNEELNSSEILERAIARVELIIASGSLEGEVKRSANSNPVSRAVSAKKVAKRIAKLEEILNGSKKTKEASKLDQSEEEKFEFKGTYVKPSNGRPSSGRPRKGSVRGRKNSSRNGSESGQDDGPMDFGSVARAKMISKDIAKNSISSAGQSTGRKDTRMLKPKMDLGKALATMGFGTARLDDVHGKRDAQDDLNASLTRLMDSHEKKKKKLLETEKIEQRRSLMLTNLGMKLGLFMRLISSLSRKYQLDKERLKEKEKEIQEFRDNGPENQEITNLIKVDLGDDDKKEIIGLGAAVALKSVARTLKESTNKTEQQSLKTKLDTND